MKRFIPLLVLALGLHAGTRAQLVFDPGTWDFGSIEESKGAVSHTFTATNKGQSPVVILDVVTSCGCTVPEFSRKPVLPGAETSVTVRFDPTNRPGTFTKHLDVYSSERRKIATLTVRGRVAARPRTVEERYPVDAGGGLRLNSTLCTFTYLFPGRRMQATVGYANPTDRTLELDLGCEHPSGVLTADFPRRIAPGEEGELNFSYLLPADRPRYGTVRDAMTVRVDGRSNGTVILAHGIGVDDFAATDPAQAPRLEIATGSLKFGAVKHDGPLQQQVLELRNTGRGELIVRAVENDGRVATTLSPGARIAPGETLAARILLDPRTQEYGVMTDHLLLITNDPTRPMRRVRVTAIIED